MYMYVDASVMPYIPNGNVHSSVVMTAMRAAGMIIDNLSQL
jgi:choline dehydrogenase-like flavoprotein